MLSFVTSKRHIVDSAYDTIVCTISELFVYELNNVTYNKVDIS